MREFRCEFPVNPGANPQRACQWILVRIPREFFFNCICAEKWTPRFVTTLSSAISDRVFGNRHKESTNFRKKFARNPENPTSHQALASLGGDNDGQSATFSKNRFSLFSFAKLLASWGGWSWNLGWAGPGSGTSSKICLGTRLGAAETATLKINK